MGSKSTTETPLRLLAALLAESVNGFEPWRG